MDAHNHVVPPPRALRILVLTTHPVADAVGGELLLHRHISRSPRDFVFHLRHLGQSPLVKRKWTAHVHRLPRRIQRLFNAWDALSGMSIAAAGLESLCRRLNPDVLYTMADGPVAMRAWTLSKKTGVPLIAQLCDWYPVGMDIPMKLEPPVVSRFRNMLRSCAVTLCMSEEIRLAAACPPNARILYPAPDGHGIPSAVTTSHALLFAGRFDHFLGPEMKALLGCVRSSGQEPNLRIIGPSEHWDDATKTLIRGTKIYGGLLKDAPLHTAIQSAAALLVIAPFGKEREHLARYSFPCKIPEYCRHGRPIIIWGPDYCSSVAWAKRTGAAITVTSADPAAVLKEMDRLSADPGQAADYARAALREAHTSFDPRNLQSIFEQAIRDAAALKRKNPAL